MQSVKDLGLVIVPGTWVLLMLLTAVVVSGLDPDGDL